MEKPPGKLILRAILTPVGTLTARRQHEDPGIEAEGRNAELHLFEPLPRILV